MHSPSAPWHLHRLDVTDEPQINAAARRIDDECGRLDVLVNNVGVVVEWNLPIEDVTAADSPFSRGNRSAEQGAEVPVKLALIGPDGPTGTFRGADDGSIEQLVPW